MRLNTDGIPGGNKFGTVGGYPIFIVWFIVILTASAAPPLRAELDSPAMRPNILLIIADDLRPDLGCYGDSIAITPNIDRLAQQGLVFERAYCQQAVCNPSRASMLTGLRPDTLRVWDLATHFRQNLPEVETLPGFFKRKGYHTRSVGKIFHNDTRRAVNRPSMADPVSWSVPPLLSTGAHWEDWVVPNDPFGAERKAESLQRLDVPDEAYFDGQVAALAVAAIKDLSESTEPFFLAVGLWKPHLPFNAPKSYWELYPEEAFSPQAIDSAYGMPDLAQHAWHELRTYTDVPEEGPLADELARALRHGYYACNSFLDAQVGKILDQLEASGFSDNTIIVFVSDHGFHLGERNLWGKTSVYELDARVPLIVSAAGVSLPNTRTKAIVELIDLYPTFVDLAGFPVPKNLEGQSFLAHLMDPSLPGKSYALTQGPQPYYTRNWSAMAYGLRTERFRYIEWRCLETWAIIESEIYDHESDPAELTNLMQQFQNSDKLKELKRLAGEAYPLNPIGHKILP